MNGAKCGSGLLVHTPNNTLSIPLRKEKLRRSSGGQRRIWRSVEEMMWFFTVSGGHWQLRPSSGEGQPTKALHQQLAGSHEADSSEASR